MPLWAAAGRNAGGGFLEKLDTQGNPQHDANIRIRVEARQTYVYAHAAALGWYPDGRHVARSGLDFINRHCLLATGFDATGPFPGMGYMLSPQHRIIDDTVDLYSQAFYLLAAAWCHRADPDGPALAMARRACEFLDDRMGSDEGGWIEAIPARLPRRQNPHMHLFEAFMALYQASGDAWYLERADQIYALFRDHFFDAQHGVLLEFFTEDWQPDPARGTLIEPGHMVEWCWLLSIYAGLRGLDLGAEMRTLYAQAIERGVNPVTGLMWDELTIAGEVTKPTHRSWSLTEYLKASIALARLGDETAARDIPRLTGLLFSTYLDAAIPGGWHDQYDGDGRVITDAMEASTFYHYLCACAELNGLADALDGRDAMAVPA
ncbi:mannose-6-phosphate isomerase [Aquisalinus flavus]|uniref:Mannose-6-phosphate isomerase n=1 Tax=Aquisalinus flavus TaxID=1526572 RepID=A0A8J2V5A2_9PROT|nr:mannose-6-phosphate isomerase [Aquisalinus flavus]